MKKQFIESLNLILTNLEAFWQKTNKSSVVAHFFKAILARLWYLFKSVFLHKYIRASFIFIGRIWLTVIVLLFYVVALNMEQTIDYLSSIGTDFKTKGYSIIIITHLSALLASLAIWYYTRILFLFTNLINLKDEDDEGDVINAPIIANEDGSPNDLDPVDFDTLSFFNKWLPLTLGCVPILTLFVCFGKAASPINALIQLVCIGVYLFVCYVSRQYITQDSKLLLFSRFQDKLMIQKDCMPRNYRTQLEQYLDKGKASGGNITTEYINHYNDFELIFPISYAHLKPLHRLFIWVGALFFLLFIAASIWFQSNLWMSNWVGPISIFLFFVVTWGWLANYVMYIDYLVKAPVSLIIIAIVLFGMGFGNNHQIRVLSDSYISKKENKELGIGNYFNHWMQDKARNHGKEFDKDSTRNVYIVATEGGGIRAAYWTAAVLAKLEESHPGFTSHVFAISGVSGGSVGSAFYTSYYKDILTEQPNATVYSSLQSKTQSFFSRDFLTPLLASFLGGDLFHKFIPLVSINSLDRAQYLEDSWAYYYDETKTGASNPLNQSFTDLWKDSTTRYQLPILFLNATHAESGRKAIITPLSFSGNKYFTEVIDLQEHVYRNIPLKTAASISARFPIVTPPATTVDDKNQDNANFVDGGYIDNSGLETAMAILSTITDNYHGNTPINIKLIFIRNSETTDLAETLKPVKGMYEYKVPIAAFVNSWDNSLGPKLTLAQEYLKGKSCNNCTIDVDPTLYTIQLDRNVGRIPLGWELSEQAENRINDQVKRLDAHLKNIYDSHLIPKH